MASGSGTLKEQIGFEARRLVDDGFGNEAAGPFDRQFECPAALVARIGGEAVTAARLAGRQVYSMRVRDTAQTRTIKTDWRAVDVRDPARIFNIRTNVALVEYPGWRELLVEEGVAS